MSTTSEKVLGYQDISVILALDGRESAQSLLRKHGVSNVGRLVNMFDTHQELHDFFLEHKPEETVSMEHCAEIWDSCNTLYCQVLRKRTKDFRGSLSSVAPVQCDRPRTLVRPKDFTAQDAVKRPKHEL